MAYVKCAACGGQVFANGRGQVLIHTVTVYGGAFGQKMSAEICRNYHKQGSAPVTPELLEQFGRAAEQLGDALEEIMPYLGADELVCRLDRRGVLITCEVRSAEALAMIAEMIVERDGDRVSFVLPEDERGPMPIPEGIDVRAEVRGGRVRMTVARGADVLYDTSRDLVS